MRIKKGGREEKKEKKKKKGEEKGNEGERGRKGKKGKGIFSHRSDGRSSTVRELKSVHAMKATRGYQNQGFSSNSKR